LAGLANAALSLRVIAEALWTYFWQCSQKRRLSFPRMLFQSAEHGSLMFQGDVFDSIADKNATRPDKRCQPRRRDASGQVALAPMPLLG
jgi:hypothetical protein